MRALWHGGKQAGELAPAAGAVLVADQLDGLGFLSARKEAILRYVAWLTLCPRKVTARHLDPLRAVGLSDDDIHDLVHVVCCFSYMNRLADGLGVNILEDRDALAVELLGEAALAAHRQWAAP